jgi:hypothetical protein
MAKLMARWLFVSLRLEAAIRGSPKRSFSVRSPDHTTIDVVKYADPNSVSTERLTGPNTGLDRRKLTAGARLAPAGNRLEDEVRAPYRMRNEHEATCLDLDCLRVRAACHETHKIRIDGVIFFRYHVPASISPPMINIKSI